MMSKTLSETIRDRIGWILLLFGILFLTGGLLRGEHAVVLEKAVHICLECIGID